MRRRRTRSSLPFALLTLLHLTAAKPPLTGRFLHLTDIHPDPFYIYNSSVGAACHSLKPEDDELRAGYWGTGPSDCDSPLRLMNATFNYLKQHLSGKIDFVVWTGDNARHDIDSRVPRSLPEILDLNREVEKRVREIFGEVPIISSIGNNDIYPHNVMWGGPSSITTDFLSIWSHFVPEHHKHTFARGAYYTVSAINDSLLLVSLNTIYMYENNKAVDGCPDYKEGKGEIDPGEEQLLWLEQQLTLARLRGQQVWLTGHVPATIDNWYPLCYEKYAKLVLRFHDTIVGQLYGHMNADHYTFLQSPHLHKPPASPLGPWSQLTRPLKSGALLDSLKTTYEGLPKKRKMNYGDWMTIHVAPSVIPTYYPAVRVWSYNITEESRWKQPPEVEVMDTLEEEEGGWTDQIPFFSTMIKKKRRKHKKRPKVPEPPRHFSNESPSMTNKFLTPLGYTQLYIDLSLANENSGYGPGSRGKELLEIRGEEGERPDPEWKVEYTTFTTEAVVNSILSSKEGQGSEREEGRLLPLSMWGPPILPLLSSNDSEGLRNLVKKMDWTPYELKDGTLREWVGLARRLVRGKKDWREFVRRMFVNSGQTQA